MFNYIKEIKQMTKVKEIKTQKAIRRSKITVKSLIANVRKKLNIIKLRCYNERILKIT